MLTKKKKTNLSILPLEQVTKLVPGDGKQDSEGWQCRSLVPETGVAPLNLV